MPTVRLEDRALILISGPDALHFLQNLVTVDLDNLPVGEVRPGALLSPQGKILFDFLVSRSDDGRLTLDCRAEVADDFVRRLMLYRLRAKVQIEKQDQSDVTVAWGDGSPAQSGFDWHRDTRFSAMPVFRSYESSVNADSDLASWLRLRIEAGVAESGSDYALGDAFPHDVLLDQLGGVGFRKGCYVGQEVVSRMQHRGTARRRVLLVKGAGLLPETGTDVLAKGRTAGVLGSVDGEDGLAILRIDRVKDAIDEGAEISAGGVAVAVAIPSWATFTFPVAAPSGEDA